MENIKDKLNQLPEQPGCYIWKDVDGNILYIGKAKNLKKRTLQYFNKALNAKTQKLVSLIADVDYIVVNNESESLILENNLIKKHRPPYNILLKEGSNSFPYIVVTDEVHPRIIYTRKPKSFKGKVYGPFANAQTNKHTNAYDLYLLLNKLFPLRKCNKLPSKECMFYHMGQCLGPCINKVDCNEYVDIKKEIDDLFNNKLTPTIERLSAKELEASQALKFEQAKVYYDYINTLKQINFEQIVEMQKNINIDIIGFYENNGQLCIIIFSFIEGKLLSKHEYVSDIYGDVDETVLSYLVQYYESTILPKEVYININSESIDLLQQKFAFKVIQPMKGKYMDLITSAINNAKEYLEKNKLKIIDTYNRTVGAQDELRKILGMNTMSQIDIIDNSNIFLEDPVSGVVVFKDGKPCKHLYRKYSLRTTIKKSDYYFMQEVILRRYTKIDELPDVLIVDGGLLQVKAAQEILQQIDLKKEIKVIGLQKNDKHQTDAIVLSDHTVYPLDKQSYLYRFLAMMQDEVHRFAITFYRNKSSKSKLNQFLDGIEGLGEKSKQKIMQIYPNIYDLKQVELSTIEQIIPKKAAKNLMIKIKAELK